MKVKATPGFVVLESVSINTHTNQGLMLPENTNSDFITGKVQSSGVEHIKEGDVVIFMGRNSSTVQVGSYKFIIVDGNMIFATLED